MVTVVHAKAHSVRVPRKNWRPFYGQKSLVQIKIQQLLDAGFGDAGRIVVSCDQDVDDCREQVESAGAEFAVRKPHDDSSMVNVYHAIYESINGDDNEDVWDIVPTNPLFGAKLLRDMRDLWEAQRNGCDSMMNVWVLQDYFMTHDGQPLNFQWGHWSTPSSELNPLLHVDYAAIVSNLGESKRRGWPVGGDCSLFRVNGPTVDIDTEEEFALSQRIYCSQWQGGDI